MPAAGVIAVETQTVMLNMPADPGMPDSAERTIPQVNGGTSLQTTTAPQLHGAVGQLPHTDWRG